MRNKIFFYKQVMVFSIIGRRYLSFSSSVLGHSCNFIKFSVLLWDVAFKRYTCKWNVFFLMLYSRFSYNNGDVEIFFTSVFVFSLISLFCYYCTVFISYVGVLLLVIVWWLYRSCCWCLWLMLTLLLVLLLVLCWCWCWSWCLYLC